MPAPNTAQQNDTTTIKKLTALDKKIDKYETTALRTRWEFGRQMLAFSDDARRAGFAALPPGFKAKLCEQTGKSRTELSYRMQFAKKYPTEDDLSNALDRFSSWREVIKSFTAGRETDTWSKERTTARRLVFDADKLRQAVEAGLAPGDVDGIREDLIFAKQSIDKALADLDAMEASPPGENHPATKALREAETAAAQSA